MLRRAVYTHSMVLSLQRALKISRPRFWLYVFGPFLLGCVSAIGSQVERIDWRILVYAIFFTFPANVLIYGVNDIFDYETDKDNPKKQGYEVLVKPSEHATLYRVIFLVTFPFVLLLFRVTLLAQLAMIGFLFFSIFYSAEPIRAKAKPFLDSLFNILYVFPGLFGFLLAGGGHVSWMAVVAGSLWCMAMHAYSAVPDISVDQANGIETIATRLGTLRTLILCIVLYAFAGVLASLSGLGFIAFLLAILYVVLMSISLWMPRHQLHTVYQYFPILNTFAGFILFVAILL